MAPPNLRNPTTIIGRTAGYAVTASLAIALDNPAASGKVLKINTIRAANIGSGATFTVDVTRRRSGVDVYLCRSTPVQAGDSLIVLSREEFFYQEEGDAIFARASSAGSIELLITYEDIS